MFEATKFVLTCYSCNRTRTDFASRTDLILEFSPRLAATPQSAVLVLHYFHYCSICVDSILWTPDPLSKAYLTFLVDVP